MDYTTNYSLKKPAPEDYYNIADFNANADAIDGKLKDGEQALTLANQLLTRVQQLEGNYAALAAKANLMLTVFAPEGCTVKLSGSTGTQTVGSSMELSLPLAAVGETTVEFNYAGAGYTGRVNMNAAGNAFLAAPIPLAIAPWAYIAKVSEKGLARSCWKIGDSKTINVGVELANVQIIGFDHDRLFTEAVDQGLTPRQNFSRAGITFGLQSVLANRYPMHVNRTDQVSWSSCAMRTTTLPALLASMNADLQAVIKTVRKTSPLPDRNSDGNSGAWAADGLAELTPDNLFLLSEGEIFGAVRCSNPYIRYDEGAYEYYKNGGSPMQSVMYWLRSVFYNDSYGFTHTIVVKPDNTVNQQFNDDINVGLLFGFCV